MDKINQVQLDMFEGWGLTEDKEDEEELGLRYGEEGVLYENEDKISERSTVFCRGGSVSDEL